MTRSSILKDIFERLSDESTVLLVRLSLFIIGLLTTLRALLQNRAVPHKPRTPSLAMGQKLDHRAQRAACLIALLGTSSALVCPAGKYGPTEYGCKACSNGQFSDLPMLDSCKLCAAGRFCTDGAGCISCKACAHGKFSETGSKTCMVCARGQYQDTSGANACKLCGVGKFAKWLYTGAVHCSPCPPGHYADRAGLVFCEMCKEGQYGIGGIAGFGLGFSQTALCSGKCDKGTFASVGSATCTPCPRGKYQAETGHAHCKSCQAGHFAVQRKVLQYKHLVVAPSIACAPCPGGQFSTKAGAHACSPCEAGRFGKPGAKSAKCTGPCPAGRHSSGGAFACLPCLHGQYQHDTGKTGCIFCSVGRSASKVGSVQCAQCTAGMYAVATSAEHCFACPAGRFGHVGAARAECSGTCTVGKFSAPGSSSCSKCNLGEFSARAGISHCTACPAGKHGARDGKHCVDCEPGRFSKAGGAAVCKLCPTGHYGTGRSQSNLCDGLCAAGRFSVSGQYACECCGMGRFQPSMGKGACEKWSVAPGYACAGRAAAARCTNTPAHRTAPLAGYRCSPPGKYNVALPNVPTPGCLECAPGQFVSASGASSCKPCAAGHFGFMGSKTCSSKCPPGKYSLAGARQCRLCSGGYYQSQSGEMKCKACPTGRFTRFVDRAMSRCHGCRAGRYNSGLRQVHCSPCPAGRFGTGDSVSSACTGNCAAGRFSKPGAATCTICPAGKFQEQSGLSYCEPCGLGRSTASGLLGSSAKNDQTTKSVQLGTQCHACAAGQYADKTGEITCKPCAAGHYGADTGATSAMCSGPCAAGHYSAAGSVTCAGCKAGFFNSMLGQARCRGCPAGKFSDPATSSVSGATTEARKTSMVRGRITACTPCAGGRFIEYEASRVCKECPPGWYSLGGARTCT